MIRPSSRRAARTLRAVVLAMPYSWWIVTMLGTIAPGASCLRPSRACPPRRAAYRLADYLATGMAPVEILVKIHIAADLVGDTGIEPVTSSV